MGWIIGTVLMTIVCTIVFFVGHVYKRAPDFATGGRIAMWGAIGFYAFWMLVTTLFASAHQIEAGHVGVVYQFGAIKGQVSEGLQFTAPWQSVAIADIRVQRHTFENISAASEETQDVFIRATVNYSVSPDAIQELYRTVGPNWFDRLVESRVLNFFKEETVKYGTVDVLPHREDIRSAVRARLVASLSPYSITVVDLLIDNIDFNPEFKAAIEQKQIATQEALRQETLVQVAVQQAEQRIAQAHGEAEAVRIAADAQAKANALLNASLTPELIQWQMIQRLSDNVEIMLVPQNGNFLFDLNHQKAVG